MIGDWTLGNTPEEEGLYLIHTMTTRSNGDVALSVAVAAWLPPHWRVQGRNGGHLAPMERVSHYVLIEVPRIELCGECQSMAN